MSKFHKAIKAAIAICFGLALWQPDSSAQTLPQLDAVIQPSVLFDTNTALFVYQYTIKNGSDSTGNVDDLAIDIARSSTSVDLSSQGLYIPAGKNNTRMIPFDQALNPGTTVQLVPIGIQNPPSHWIVGISVTGLAGWGAGTGASTILSGQTMDGFTILSRGVPAIRNARLEPEFVFTSAGDEAGDSDFTQAAKTEEKISAYSQVVGPDAPASLAPGDLISRLASLKHAAAALGWIAGPGADGIIQSLDAKLDAANSSVASGDGKTAANQINAFINEVQAQRGKHVNDNAYYLLTANAQYILTRLGP